MMLTHILQHFNILDIVWETQRQSWQEGIISWVQQGGFQHDCVSRTQSKVLLLTENKQQDKRQTSAYTRSRQQKGF